MNIIQSKLTIPTLRSNLVSRQRLIDKLTAGSSRRLTLVSAPAGVEEAMFTLKYHVGF
jgi:ATP/maltotriose-dependent transcriptional regulator MalT